MAAFRAMHSFADNVRTAPVFEGIAALLIEACIVPRRSLSMPERSMCLRGLSTCLPGTCADRNSEGTAGLKVCSGGKRSMCMLLILQLAY